MLCLQRDEVGGVVVPVRVLHVVVSVLAPHVALQRDVAICLPGHAPLLELHIRRQPPAVPGD